MHSVVLRRPVILGHPVRDGGRFLLLRPPLSGGGQPLRQGQGNVLRIGTVSRRLFWSFSKKKSHASDVEASAAALVKNKLRPSRFTKGALVVLGISVWGTYRSIEVVESGQVGVVEILGVIQDDLLEPGLHLVRPYARVTKFNTRNQRTLVKSKTRIRGGLFVELEVVVVYKLDITKIKQIYEQHAGGHGNGTTQDDDWHHVESVARSVLHSVVAKKSMEQMHDTQQWTIGQEIKTKLNEIYKQDGGGGSGIVVEQVIFQKVKLPDYLITAIQELHMLDLEISQDKRIVDGQLAVARGTAAARSALKPEDGNQNKATKELPAMYKTAMADVQKRGQETNLPKVTETQKPMHLSKTKDTGGKEDEGQEPTQGSRKKMLEKVFPFISFFGDNKDDDKNNSKDEKKLPTLKGYVRQVKEDRKVLDSVFPFYFFSKKKKEEDKIEGEEDEATPVVEKKDEDKDKTPKKDDGNKEATAVLSSKDAAQVDNNSKTDTAAAAAKVVEDPKVQRVDEAKLPSPATTSDNKPDPASLDSSSTTGAAAPLQGTATTTTKAKAAGETEKE